MAVFSPTGTSQAIIKAVQPYIKSGKLLDLGCGCGIVGRSFIDKCDVHFSDISGEAIKCISLGIAKCGNLFEPWQGETFDWIIDDVSGISEEVAKTSSWFNGVPCESGRDGTKLVVQVIQQSPKYLNKNGKLFFPIVSFSNERKILDTARASFKDVELLSHTEFPLPKEMQRYKDLLRELKSEGCINYTERFGMIMFWTNVYMVSND